MNTKMKRKAINIILVIALCMSLAIPVSASAQTVNPTSSTVIVNGTATAFEAYNIRGNNFFKLRDLAYALNGSSKQFAVGFDGAENAISLTSGEPYEAVGGEMAQGDGTAKIANPTSSRVFLDGQELNLTAYNIGGNNFFRLRDLMRELDIGVTWDSATSTIGIDTSIGYVEDAPASGQTGQATTSDRIREFDPWIADNMDRYASELGMTIDEIFDYAREASRFEYIFENDLEIGELADVVGLSSSDFLNILSSAYTFVRSVDAVNRWAVSLDMTVDELYEARNDDDFDIPFDEVMERVNRDERVYSTLSKSLGVDWFQFQFVLTNVSNAQTMRDFRTNRE